MDEGVFLAAHREAVRRAVRREGMRVARAADEEIPVSLHVAKRHSRRSHRLPFSEDAPDERGFELRVADEVVKDVAEKDDGSKAPSGERVEGTEEVVRVALGLTEVRVGENGHSPLEDPLGCGESHHRGIVRTPAT